MRMVVLTTLALAQGFGPGSLGIGVDVFMPAYGFAASRVGASADLRLLSCTQARCLWALGNGVTVTAEHPVESLDLTRIEVTFDPTQPADAGARRRYEEACLTVVALVDPGAPATARRTVASEISSPPGFGTSRIRIERPDRNIRVYGIASPPDGKANATASRCGAIAGFE